MKRREFLTASTGCACLMMERAGWAAPASPGPVTVGALKSFMKEGLDTRWVSTHGFFLVRNQDHLFAVSATCTHDHRTHVMGRPGGDKLVCPNHGSQYAQDGTLIRGPARHNLGHFSIHVDDKGQVVVDTSRLLDQAEWGDSTAYVKVE